MVGLRIILTGALAAPLLLLAGSPAVAANAPADVSPIAVGATTAHGAVHAFVRGTNGEVYQKTGTAAASWRKLPGQVASGPAATTDADGLIHLMARGPGKDVLWNRETAPNVWTGWSSLGGVATSAPDVMVVNLAVDRLIVAIRGNDGAYWVRVRTGDTWAGWQPIGGRWTSAPALIGYGGVPDGWTIDVLGRGLDGDQYTTAFPEGRFIPNARWEGTPREFGLASAFGTGTQAIENSPGSNLVGPWYVTAAGNLHAHLYNEPDPPARKLTSAPAATLAGSDVTPESEYWQIVFARGADGALWALPAQDTLPPRKDFGAWQSWGGVVA